MALQVRTTPITASWVGAIPPLKCAMPDPGDGMDDDAVGIHHRPGVGGVAEPIDMSALMQDRCAEHLPTHVAARIDADVAVPRPRPG